jgi:hypothetical protein
MTLKPVDDKAVSGGTSGRLGPNKTGQDAERKLRPDPNPALLDSSEEQGL